MPLYIPASNEYQHVFWSELVDNESTKTKALKGVQGRASVGAQLMEEQGPTVLQGIFQDDWGVADLLHAIDSIKASLSRANMLMPELSLNDKSAEIVEGAIRCGFSSACDSCSLLIARIPTLLHETYSISGKRL